MNEKQDVIAEITAERQRQKDVEGWTEAHDDEHEDGALANAAACYAMADPTPFLDELWPWWNANFDSAGYETSSQKAWWKPKDRRRNLIRAAALIVAEIERMDRAARAEQPS